MIPFRYAGSKGVGRIYQYSAIDTYSSFGFAYLYTDKSAKSAIDFIDKTINTFAQMGITVEIILTDHGKEYTTHWEGSYHPFEDYLDLNCIQRYAKVRYPWTNGFVERFPRTVLEEFYQSALLKKTYHNLGELQDDLGQFLYFYNFKKNASRLWNKRFYNLVIYYINVVTFYLYQHKIIINILCLEEVKL